MKYLSSLSIVQTGPTYPPTKPSTTASIALRIYNIYAPYKKYGLNLQQTTCSWLGGLYVTDGRVNAFEMYGIQVMHDLSSTNLYCLVLRGKSAENAGRFTDNIAVQVTQLAKDFRVRLIGCIERQDEYGGRGVLLCSIIGIRGGSGRSGLIFDASLRIRRQLQCCGI